MFFRRNTVPEIDAVTLHGKTRTDHPPKLIDVREREEHADGIIKGAILLPMRNLREQIGTVCPDLSQEIVVYCHSGARSASCAAKLIQMGYTNVSSLQNGIIAWFRQGYEIVTP